MLVARTISGEILKHVPDEEYFDAEDDRENVVGSPKVLTNIYSRDPGIDDSSWQWLVERAEGPFSTLIRSNGIFSTFEFDRKVPLMFTLNVMCSYLLGYYERNDQVRKMLDERSSTFSERQDVIDILNVTADYIKAMALPANSPWWNKANFFTIVVELARLPELRIQPADVAGSKLQRFAERLPEGYALAAREAVSRKPQRELRGKLVRAVLQDADR